MSGKLLDYLGLFCYCIGLLVNFVRLGSDKPLFYAKFNPTTKIISFWVLYPMPHLLWNLSTLINTNKSYYQPMFSFRNCSAYLFSLLFSPVLDDLILMCKQISTLPKTLGDPSADLPSLSLWRFFSSNVLVSLNSSQCH